MAETLEHTGAFVEIVAVKNGFAVYDFSQKNHALDYDRKAVPLLVFNDKEELAAWLVANWNPHPLGY